ncbi:hypothetical protein ACFOSC_26525 [Streptantibioticus rubrisoli]|uniref:Uncharacterized protein n=1 Tax=Streptantibioticus rubrisoli TaxID=1387313 RepID=A0ABT1PET3_9ACTN|nr:hypothetical protein [Streptantibioticus rubrisoli]MCQ4043867.1 hypothetical protein [Streptantibioticus rubrisoli]
MCALGAPWYTVDLPQICGPAPVPHITLDNSRIIYDQACLKLEGGSTWASGAVSLIQGTPPAVDCDGYVAETSVDTGGTPIVVCRDASIYMRETFMAVLTGTDGGSATVCIMENTGA